MPVTRSSAKLQQTAKKPDAKARSSVAPVRKSSRLAKKDPVPYGEIHKAKLLPGGFVTAAKLLSKKEPPKTLPGGFITAGQLLDQNEGWTVVSKGKRNPKVTPATTERDTATEDENVNRFASLTQFILEEGKEKEIEPKIGENLEDIFKSVATKPSSSALKGENLKDFIQSLASKESDTEDDSDDDSEGTPPPPLIQQGYYSDSDSDDEAPLLSLLSMKRGPISQKHFAYLPGLDTPPHANKSAALKPREPETDGSTGEETAELLKKQVFSAEHKAKAEMTLKRRSEQRKRRLAGLEKQECGDDKVQELLMDLKDQLDEDMERLKEMKTGESVAEWNEYDTFMEKQDGLNWLFKRYSEELYPDLATLEPMSPDTHTPPATPQASAQARMEEEYQPYFDTLIEELENYNSDDDRKLPAKENTDEDEVMETPKAAAAADEVMETPKAAADDEVVVEEPTEGSTDGDAVMEEPSNAQPWVGQIFLRDPRPLAKPRQVTVTPQVQPPIQRHDRDAARSLITPDYEESSEDWKTKSIQQKLAHIAKTVGYIESDNDALESSIVEKLNSLKVIDSDDDLKARDYQALLKISDRLMAGALSERSEKAYEKHQQKYIKFCKYFNIEWNKEESLSSYLTALHHAYAGSTLWTIYSCISSLFRRHGIDVKQWAGVKAIMRTITKNHIYKKSAIFSGEDM